MAPCSKAHDHRPTRAGPAPGGACDRSDPRSASGGASTPVAQALVALAAALRRGGLAGRPLDGVLGAALEARALRAGARTRRRADALVGPAARTDAAARVPVVGVGDRAGDQAEGGEEDVQDVVGAVDGHESEDVVAVDQ